MVSVAFVQAISVDRLCDRVLSMSSSSLDRIGDRIDEMQADLAVALAPFAAEGILREQVEARAEIFAAA